MNKFLNLGIDCQKIPLKIQSIKKRLIRVFGGLVFLPENQFFDKIS
jgi:hypothetical protein